MLRHAFQPLEDVDRSHPRVGRKPLENVVELPREEEDHYRRAEAAQRLQAKEEALVQQLDPSRVVEVLRLPVDLLLVEVPRPARKKEKQLPLLLEEADPVLPAFAEARPPVVVVVL